MPNNDMQNRLRLQEAKLNNVNNQMGSQSKIQNLRDDPLAAGHLVRYQSYLGRLERFESNAQTVNDQYTVTEGYMNQSMQIMQRVRELSVQAATGTYTPDDMKNMSTEVDELLKELVLAGNAVGPDGNFLFGGTRNRTAPFEVVMGDVPGASDAMIKQVRYNGTIESALAEIDENAYIEVNHPGNQVFWAEQQKLFPQRDATAYQVMQDSSISIDGKTIDLKTGDNVYSIISKINDSGAAVKAWLDPVSRGLNLETTDARQLWMEDIGVSTVLNDLGVIKEAGQRPPHNLANGSVVSGGSLFDSVIALRDSMLTGDHESVGGRVLGSIDQALDNLGSRLAQIGSQYERVAANLSRHNTNIPNVTAMVAREGDLDITKAITDMKMMEYAHQASLSVASKLYSNSLLNYMR
jgi:flagellar hook-associated protein 3 FlgL